MRLTLAPGVSFNEGKHEYFFKGKKLSGITSSVNKLLGLSYSSSFVEEHRVDGLHVHKAVQLWIETGRPQSIHEGAVWIVNCLSPLLAKSSLYAEVLVSDFKSYASMVDIVEDTGNGLNIYDIKAGAFKRDSVTWQLSIYKYFIEKFSNYRVDKCICISVKDREFYKVFPKPFDKVEALLYA